MRRQDAAATAHHRPQGGETPGIPFPVVHPIGVDELVLEPGRQQRSQASMRICFMLPLVEADRAGQRMSDIAQWLIVNTLFPLLPIPIFYLFIWISKGSISWVPPIRDGQVCFYSTIIAILAIKDIYGTNPAGVIWFWGLAGCWIFSLVVYSYSIYSAIYPTGTTADKEAIDWRIALASLFLGALTTLCVVTLRMEYGVLK